MNLNHQHIHAHPSHQILPLIAIKTSPKVEGHRNQPRVTVHSNQRKPVPTVHAIPSKIDSKSRLRELWWNFLCRQSYLPGLIRVSIEAQVILILKKHTRDFKFNGRPEHIIQSLQNLNLMGIKTHQNECGCCHLIRLKHQNIPIR